MDKKTTKKTKEIVKKDDKKLVWSGARRLMEKPETDKERKERNLILLTASVLNVSPFGVNILGNQPYINNLGLREKASQYDPDIKFLYDWVNYSQNDTDKAICKCKIVSKGKDITDWVVGECSPSTMKMGTLKGYQNHMAQTRARNRAIQEAFGVRIHEEMMKNIEELSRKQAIDEKQYEAIGNSLTTSAEEIQQEEKSKEKSLFAEDKQIEDLKKLARELGAKEGEEKAFIEKISGLKPNWDSLTQRQISILKASLLNGKVE